MFEGWSPAYETTYTYDSAGRIVSSIQRQIEPEWDETTRNRVLALAVYDQQVCSGCHVHESQRDLDYTFEEQVCPVCQGKDVYQRILADRDDKATPKDAHGKPNLKPRDPRPSDGRQVFLRPMSPLEVAERHTSGRDRREVD